MAATDDAQLESAYTALLESLEGEQREEVLQTVAAADAALGEVCTRFEAELAEHEQNLQACVQDYEAAQTELNGANSDSAEDEELKARHTQASEAMEKRMAERTEKSIAYAEVHLPRPQSTSASLRTASITRYGRGQHGHAVTVCAGDCATGES